MCLVLHKGNFLIKWAGGHKLLRTFTLPKGINHFVFNHAVSSFAIVCFVGGYEHWILRSLEFNSGVIDIKSSYELCLHLFIVQWRFLYYYESLKTLQKLNWSSACCVFALTYMSTTLKHIVVRVKAWEVTHVDELNVFFQIPTTPERRPQPSPGGSSHRHSDLLQEQRLRSVDTRRWHRHPAVRVRRLMRCDVI